MMGSFIAEGSDAAREDILLDPLNTRSQTRATEHHMALILMTAS
jgi:hypothetical protein